MKKNIILIALMSLVCLAMLSPSVKAARITSCTLSSESYYPGQTGYAIVDIYNDKENTIRVPELTVAINYYYNDDTVYQQTFYTYRNPPTEIEPNQTRTFNAQFNLPSNVAPGYTTITVRAKTDLWNQNSQRWESSDYPSIQQLLYIESPYKPQYQEQNLLNDQLQEQLLELQAINSTTTTMMYLLGLTTLIFAMVMVFLVVLSRKAKVIPQPAA